MRKVLIMNYWEKRIVTQTDRIYNKTVQEAEVELRKLYRESLKANEQQMIDVWNSIKDSENGEVKPNDLYRYNRYFSISKALQESLRQLGDKEVNVYQRAFESAYKRQYEFITKMIREKKNNRIVNQDILKFLDITTIGSKEDINTILKLVEKYVE